MGSNSLAMPQPLTQMKVGQKDDAISPTGSLGNQICEEGKIPEILNYMPDTK
jgi:hypothetical protein